MNKLTKLSILLPIMAITACSDIEEYAKCRAAADALGEHDAVSMINKKFHENNMEQYLPKNSWEIAQMVYEIKDDLGLLEPPSLATRFRLIKVFNSCADIHEQPKLRAPSFHYYIMYPFL